MTEGKRKNYRSIARQKQIIQGIKEKERCAYTYLRGMVCFYLPCLSFFICALAILPLCLRRGGGMRALPTVVYLCTSACCWAGPSLLLRGHPGTATYADNVFTTTLPLLSSLLLPFFLTHAHTHTHTHTHKLTHHNSPLLRHIFPHRHS